jgi:hypothetical protein
MQLARLARMRVLLLLVVLGSSSVACYVGPSGGERSEILAEEEQIEVVTAAGEPSAQRPMRHPAAAWIDHEGSPILPWCGAVLVAPDVAVTAARCIDGWDRSWLNVGFGAVDGAVVPIDEIVVQRDVEPREHALAALRLAEPALGVEPMTLTIAAPPSCGVETVAYRYVLRDEAVREEDAVRRVWTGCLEGDRVRADAGEPNCHGDMGAGAIAGDALVGIAVDAWSEGACMVGHELATVAANEAFFDEALELSRPPV